jgi:hypothetical protein
VEVFTFEALLETPFDPYRAAWFCLEKQIEEETLAGGLRGSQKAALGTK